MWVFCLRLLNFVSTCTLNFQVAHCFSSSDLTTHNQEMNENVHSHLQMSKGQVIFFFWQSFYTFLTLSHIMNGALCQQPCILNLNMYVKWMAPTFSQLCNHYNLITSNNVLQLGYKAEIINVVTYYFLYAIFHLQYVCCSSVGQILTYSVPFSSYASL